MKLNARLHLVLCWSAFVAWAAGVITLSSLQPNEMARYGHWLLRMLEWDKAVHAGVFAIGALLLAMALWSSSSLPPRRVALIVFFGISLFGAIDEWHQLHTPGRSGADVGDWIADTAGAAFGALFFVYAGTRFRKSTQTGRAAPAAG